MINEALGTTIEDIADEMISPHKVSRRGFLSWGARSARRLMQSANPVNEKLISEISEEMPTLPFKGIAEDQAIEQIRLQAELHPELSGIYQRAIDEINAGKLNNHPIGTYGNHTWYGNNQLWESPFSRNRGRMGPDKDQTPEQMKSLGLLCAPNPLYFNQELWSAYVDIRQQAMDLAGLSLEDLQHGRPFPEGIFNQLVVNNYPDFKAEMQKVLGKNYLYVVVKPKDKTYFQEGPYWQANSLDIEAKNNVGWDVQYAQVLIAADVKAAHHLWYVTPELSGRRDSNFIADLQNPGFAGELNPFRNRNNRPLGILLQLDSEKP